MNINVLRHNIELEYICNHVTCNNMMYLHFLHFLHFVVQDQIRKLQRGHPHDVLNY